MWNNVAWLYGPPGSGKSTLATLLSALCDATVFDADLLRQTWPDLGFAKEDKLECARRLLVLAQNTVGRVVVACVTPHRVSRTMVISAGCTLVRVRTDEGVYKGRRPHLAEFKDVAGFDAPFEDGDDPEVRGDAPIPYALESIIALMGWRSR